MEGDGLERRTRTVTGTLDEGSFGPVVAKRSFLL